MENIFIGVILTATSISISVETLTELGKLNSRVGVNILGAAVIDDIIGLVLISMLLAYKGNGGTSFFLTLLYIAVFCGAGLLAVAYLPRFLAKYMKNIHPSRTVLTFALSGALIAAFVAEEAGIAAITGAYLCGLLLSQFGHKEYLERNVKAISSGFLSLVFFASIGLQIKFESISGTVIFVSIMMFFVAVLGKIIGCGFGARLFKMNRSESLQIGVGMISRGEVAIITANIGLQSRMISQEAFLPTLIVVLLTTIMTPILLKIVFSHKVDNKLMSNK